MYSMKDLASFIDSHELALIKKQMGTQLVQYDEPQVDISMKGRDSLMVLGQGNITDFSGQSSGGLSFRDYKDAYTEDHFSLSPCQ